MVDYKLNALLTATAKTLEGKESLWTVALAKKAEGLVDLYPHDPTCVGMYRFLEQRAIKQPLISKAEVRSVYNSLYSRGNMFAQSFENELGGLEMKGAVVRERDVNENKPFETGVDKDVLATVAGLFTPSLQLLSEGTTKRAEAVCLRGMNAFSYKPYSVTSLASNENGVVCSVGYETPKGMVNVVVPVEVEAGVGPLEPTVFVSQGGFTDLTEENVKHFIQTSAGKRYSIEPTRILQAIKVAKKGMVDPMEKELDGIIARARMGTDTSNANDIVGLKVMDADPVEPQLFPEETKAFAAELSSLQGSAEFLFGKAIISATKNGIVTKLKDWGFSAPKVSVANFDEGGVMFAANIDNLGGFTVSATIKDGLCKLADVVVSGGGIFDFTRDGMDEMMRSDVDVVAVAAASTVQHLGPQKLVDVVVDAVQNGNMASAEEALMTLQAQGEEAAYLQAFKVYLDGMSGGGVVKVASAENHHKCTMIRKVASSKYQICGHTGLPLHKVFQNELGECLPLYRKHQEAPGSAHILQHKIAWT